MPCEPARDRRHFVTLLFERRHDVLPAPLIGGVREKEHQPRNVERRTDPQLPPVSHEHADARVRPNVPASSPLRRHAYDATPREIGGLIVVEVEDDLPPGPNGRYSFTSSCSRSGSVSPTASPAMPGDDRGDRLCLITSSPNSCATSRPVP
jgi:hypothetical protein